MHHALYQIFHSGQPGWWSCPKNCPVCFEEWTGIFGTSQGANQCRPEADAIRGQKRAGKHQKRIAELDNYIKRLYEGNASGKIPDRQFEKLMAQYDSEQQELEERVKEIEVSIHEIQQESENGQQFVRLVQKYRDLTEIDQTALNEFIDKVVVHEATGGRTADRSQQIDIYFNFIGQFMVEDTEEELLMQEQEAQRLADLKERERKDRRNETIRRYRQRKKEREVKQAESVSG